jgi:hypothetical protein
LHRKTKEIEKAVGVKAILTPKPNANEPFVGIQRITIL